MNEQLELTLTVLESTRNEAAVDVLWSAIENGEFEARREAFNALMRRRTGDAPDQVVRRWHEIPADLKPLVATYPVGLDAALRRAIESSDDEHCARALDLAAWARAYELMPVLVGTAENAAQPRGNVAAETLLELAEELHEECAREDSSIRRRDPAQIRLHVLKTLERSVERFSAHGRRELLESFLMLVDRDNATLRHLLSETETAGHVATMELLSRSAKPGVVRLLLGLLDDDDAPRSIPEFVSVRRDPEFVRQLLSRYGAEDVRIPRENLRQVTDFGWLRDGPEFVRSLDAGSQRAALRLVVESSIDRRRALELTRQLFRHGEPASRREATRALGRLDGVEADGLLLEALKDEDPKVQVIAAELSKTRAVPGAVPLLLNLLDSKHGVVREAARANLGDFNMSRYLESYDDLDGANRAKMAALVKKVDFGFVETLLAELDCGQRARALRALDATAQLRILSEVEPRVLSLLEDDDHFVREAAAKALAEATSEGAVAALERAREDSSLAVRRIVDESLREIARRSARPAPLPSTADELLGALAEGDRPR